MTASGRAHWKIFASGFLGLLMACSGPAADLGAHGAIPRLPTLAELSARTLAPGDALLIGAGDIAQCGPQFPNARATADLIAKFPQATVFTAGDNAYGNATAKELADCYGQSWGAFKSRTRPSPGNHDYGLYLNPPRNDAGPYFDYFGANAGPRGLGYYSYDLGGWHIVALNSMAGQPGAGSTPSMAQQAAWLDADLGRTRQACILAYWHHPLFTSGPHGDDPNDPGRKVGPLWEVLLRHRADVIVNGHDHHYEWFAPRSTSGVAMAHGIRQFVVGTGGGDLRPVTSDNPDFTPLDEDYGVLLLTLHPASYEWHFLKTDGTLGDASPGPSLCN